MDFPVTVFLSFTLRAFFEWVLDAQKCGALFFFFRLSCIVLFMDWRFMLLRSENLKVFCINIYIYRYIYRDRCMCVCILENRIACDGL